MRMNELDKIKKLKIKKEKTLIRDFYAVLNSYLSMIPEEVDIFERLKKIRKYKLLSYKQVMVTDERVKMLESNEYNSKEKELIEEEILSDIELMENGMTLPELMDYQGLGNMALLDYAKRIIASDDMKASARMTEFLLKLRNGYLLNHSKDNKKQEQDKTKLINSILKKLEEKGIKIE